MLHRARDLLIRQRTMTINALRGHLAELGIVSAKGRAGVSALVALVEDDRCGSAPDGPARIALRVLAAQLRSLQGEISALEREIMAWHRNDAASKRLATIPGIGYLTASALSATLGDGSAFGSARQLSAWLGLVPRQNSTGGKARLGRITKQGDPYLRRLLVIGATSALKGAASKEAAGSRRTGRSRRTGPYPWAEAMLPGKPYRLVTVALANKMARIVWAVLVGGQPYRPMAAAAV